jgi:hypothetical protein
LLVSTLELCAYSPCFQASVQWLEHALPTEPSDNEAEDVSDGSESDSESEEDDRGARSQKAAVPPPSRRVQVGTIKQKPFKHVSDAGKAKIFQTFFIRMTAVVPVKLTSLPQTFTLSSSLPLFLPAFLATFLDFQSKRTTPYSPSTRTSSSKKTRLTSGQNRFAHACLV